MNITEQAQEQVLRFCKGIELWFDGKTEKNDYHAAEILRHFSPEFNMVSPSSQLISYAELSTWLLSVHGARRNISIVADQFVARYVGPEAVVITYRETQRMPEQSNIRLASALFVLGSDNEVKWTHLHETWVTG